MARSTHSRSALRSPFSFISLARCRLGKGESLSRFWAPRSVASALSRRFCASCETPRPSQSSPSPPSATTLASTFSAFSWRPYFISSCAKIRPRPRSSGASFQCFSRPPSRSSSPIAMGRPCSSCTWTAGPLKPSSFHTSSICNATGPSTIFFSTGVPCALMGRSTSALPGTPFGNDETGARIAAPPFSCTAAFPPAPGPAPPARLGVFDMLGAAVARGSPARQARLGEERDAEAERREADAGGQRDLVAQVVASAEVEGRLEADVVAVGAAVGAVHPGGAVGDEAVEDDDPRFAEHAPPPRHEEVPLHHDGEVEVRRRAVAVVPAAVVVLDVESERDRDVVVDRRDEPVVDQGDGDADPEAPAAPGVGVVRAEEQVRFELEVVGGVIAGALDGVVGAGRGAGRHEDEGDQRRVESGEECHLARNPAGWTTGAQPEIALLPALPGCEPQWRSGPRRLRVDRDVDRHLPRGHPRARRPDDRAR